MLKHKREMTDKIFPKECYISSFYDFYHKGKRHDLRKCDIIATQNLGFGKDVYYGIYFKLNECDDIVLFRIREDFIISKGDKNNQTYFLKELGLWKFEFPQKIFSFLMTKEDDYIRCHKEVCQKEILEKMLLSYEAMINYSAYEIDMGGDFLPGGKEYVFFKDYESLWELLSPLIK